MDNLNVKTRNGERGNEIDSRLVDKIEECRFNIAKKASEFIANYENSSDTDEKNLIAYRVCALKCDVPEIMDFVRKFNQDLANQVEQVGIENRIAEVECSKNIKENADIGLNNVSEQVDIENHVVELDHPKNVKESADIGLNNAGDTNDKDAEKEKRVRNAAAKKLGDMLLKIDWANIKFDEEVEKFEKLDPETIRQAIKSDKINGLNLVFLRYVLFKIYIKLDNELLARDVLLKDLKRGISIVQIMLDSFNKLSKKVRDIRIKNGDLDEDGHYSTEYYSDDRYVGDTDKERNIEKKAREVYAKAKRKIRSINEMNKRLLLIGRKVDESGTGFVPKDICGFFKKLENMNSICVPEKVTIIPRDEGYGYLINPEDAIKTIDEEIEKLPKDLFIKMSKEYSKAEENIKQMDGSLNSI